MSDRSAGSLPANHSGPFFHNEIHICVILEEGDNIPLPLGQIFLCMRTLSLSLFFCCSSWAVPVKSQEEGVCNHCAVYFSFLVNSDIGSPVYGKPS